MKWRSKTALVSFLLLILTVCLISTRGQVFDAGGLRAPNIKAPDLPPPGDNVSGTAWINSSPLTMAQLRGKVVMIDFWEYTCINCIRTFALNKMWYARYHKDGFEIIGVHDPEFDFAYSADNVRTAVKRFGLPYPVVVDDWFTIWKSYHNNIWPRRFLIDAKGIVRYDRSGEGADSSLEQAIRILLIEADPGLKFPENEPIVTEDNPTTARCGVTTDEMYVGDWEGHGVLANAEGYHQGKSIRYNLRTVVADGAVAVSGPWETDKNGMIYRGKGQSPSENADRFEMRYHARELYTVINAEHGKPSRLYIQQDGKYLTATDKGVDLQIDSEGRSYIDVRESRMYYLVANPSFGAHSVSLIPTARGLTVNSFSFGNNCQTKFPHL